MKVLLWIYCIAFLTISVDVTVAAEPIVVADFEGADYGDWKITGTAMGARPARGTLPGQMAVAGFAGKGLVNSFHGGDDATGELKSPPFKIERNFITFLIGGGGWADETCINLEVDGKIVRTATGSNTQGGGTERLEPAAWDLGPFLGKNATIAIVDRRQGGWGHINVDQILQTDDRGSAPLVLPLVPLVQNVTREIVAQRKLLHFPVKTGAKSRVVTIKVDANQFQRFDIELADEEADWWAPLDISSWTGRKLTLTANALPENSKAFDSLKQSDKLLGDENLYAESLRSQLHFSPQRGWMNDPNGLVFFNGEFHLFFQHNPYGWNWGNMHWGHATSRDLVHWQEHGEALYPDDMGPMFSGSAVVDWNNTSGFGKEGKPPLVLIYTAAGNPTVQGIAYSHDGRHFTKYDENPVIKQISPGNRDPKVFWHEPTRRWIMALYVEMPGKLHTVHLFTSPNLKEWTLGSIAEGGIDGDKCLFECPDMFELAIDGDLSNKKWVLTAANSVYAVGTFDGRTFTPELKRLADVRGIGFYAAQTFSDAPDGRRIQIGWMQAPSPGMSFNQLQSIPCELSLVATSAGPRLSRRPIPELESLREGANQAASLSSFKSELVELVTEFEPKGQETFDFQIRGAKIRYDAGKQEISVNGHLAAAPLTNGKQRVQIYVDRTVVEVFASNGLTYVPVPFIANPENLSVSVETDGQPAKLSKLEVYKLKSAWNGQK